MREWRQISSHCINNGNYYVSKSYSNNVPQYHAWRGHTTKYRMSEHIGGPYESAAQAKARCTRDMK